MFKVRNIKDGKVRTAYAVHGTMLLFYEDGMWIYDDIANYEPEGEER